MKLSDRDIAGLALGDLPENAAEELRRRLEADRDAALRLERMERTLGILQEWIEAHAEHTAPVVPSHRPRFRWSARTAVPAIAASLLVAFGVGVLFIGSQEPPEPPPALPVDPVPPATVAPAAPDPVNRFLAARNWIADTDGSIELRAQSLPAPTGQPVVVTNQIAALRRVALTRPGDVTLWLEPGCVVQLPDATDESRRVQLVAGKLTAEIVRLTDRTGSIVPFVLTSAPADIEVRGTVFSAELNKATQGDASAMIKKKLLTVMLLTGALNVSNPHGAVAMKPGDVVHATEDSAPKKAEKAAEAGNYRDAYDIWSRLISSEKGRAGDKGKYLSEALRCLRKLGRVNEYDALIEKAVQNQKDNWRLLLAAAKAYRNAEHYGYRVAGEFRRGQHRGGGQLINGSERDRVRALQLMDQALKSVRAEKDPKAAASFYLEFADMLTSYRGYSNGWRLHYLSDISELPDYASGRDYSHYRGNEIGAPVDEQQNPVFCSLPESYESARSDGERWRWALQEAVRLDPAGKNKALFRLASLMHNQFGVRTLQSYSWYLGMGRDKEDAEKAPYTLHTLTEQESMAKLATGMRRFPLPDDLNFIRIYREIADNPAAGKGEDALNALAAIFEDRRRYPAAAAFWQRTIKEYGPGKKDWKKKRLSQIVGNWGRFETVRAQPASRGCTVDFRFRNATNVTFTAQSLDVATLLGDVKSYLKTHPKRFDWDRIRIDDIGYNLVHGKSKKYVGDTVATWNMPLTPPSGHFDERVTVTTPLQKPGAYWVTARVAGGNTTHVVLWVHDTVIVRKPLDNGVYYYVADAVTGRPVAGANVELFAYSRKWLGNSKYDVKTTNFAERTDDNGQVIIPGDQLPDRKRTWYWIAVARTDDGRLAHQGFTYGWVSACHDRDYNAVKVYTATDRPVYRPGHTVRYKLWARHARYDRDKESVFAGRSLEIDIADPKGEKLQTRRIRTDEYGGFDGEIALAKDAVLGRYSVSLHDPNHIDKHTGKKRRRHLGGGNFRVEEYKKPEFEVTVEAPKEPVMLGDRITATVKAAYYFGAPVTEARVKYKVTRSSHSAEWYPPSRWDWFYGPGYWWFAYDYDWYPGWRIWGCCRPMPSWWRRNDGPPEVVAEAETTIGSDGSLKIEIDTGPAKIIHGDTDHRYEITAEVVDASRRTIVGSGRVLVARTPFKVYAWVDRGHYRVGDVIEAGFAARALDNKPVPGNAGIELFRISYDKAGKPVEKRIDTWQREIGADGTASLKLKATEPGQYRLACVVTDERKQRREGAYVFTVAGPNFRGDGFRFNDLELVVDKKEYAAGDKVQLRINANHPDSTVLLFVRPANSVYLAPRVVQLDGKSTTHEISVRRKDMPNFFVEAITINNGSLYNETREIAVPPEKRLLNVKVAPSSEKYKPGEKAKVRVNVTDSAGNPFAGAVVMSVYDRSVDYIAGGSNPGEIREFFWKWRRHHYPATAHSLSRSCSTLVDRTARHMRNVGAFGDALLSGGKLERYKDALACDDPCGRYSCHPSGRQSPRAYSGYAWNRTKNPVVALPESPGLGGGAGAAGSNVQEREPVVRRKFADTAFWAGALVSDSNGLAEVSFDMPENVTGWKIRAWALGHGTKVGEATAEVATAKDLLLRLQAPRFFVEKDEVVLSANIHNYLKADKTVRALLELHGDSAIIPGAAEQTTMVKANGEARVDWLIKVVKQGDLIVRMKALTDEESDAVQMQFPAHVHGMLKTESFSTAMRPEDEHAEIVFTVPNERRSDQTRLEIRYSPTLAGAMIDALPYLAAYPYKTSDAELDRFLPAALTRKILVDTGIDLKTVREKHTNLNAQELGDAGERAEQWRKRDEDLKAVFDNAVVTGRVKKGLRKLAAAQRGDGGWAWFAGRHGRSSVHVTAYIVHGLLTAKESGIAIVPSMLDRGVKWLEGRQQRELRKIRNAEAEREPWKRHADNMDAFVFMVLAEAGKEDKTMLEFLYRDRTHLSVYAKAMFGLALHKNGHEEKLAMIMQNIEQYLVEDEENQSAWLRLPNSNCWWRWYGSETEAHAFYLKLLARVDPKSRKASRLAKYILNNRKHATYWNSTRDTALCVQALAEYLKASGEDRPDMTLEITVDGKKMKEIRINAENLFTFDNMFGMTGDAVSSGKHTVEFRKKGTGPLYANAYLTNFTLEDDIKKTGLEVKIERAIYKLVRADRSVKARGSRGQAVDRRVERYERKPLANLSALNSGDLVEVELTVHSKNDYEYIMIEDMKAAGFEAVALRSGYGRNELGAYMELRDERVVFFVQRLARGTHSVSYRLRAETPGRFSALPSRISGVYAPELRGNSDEIKLRIRD